MSASLPQAAIMQTPAALFLAYGLQLNTPSGHHSRGRRFGLRSEGALKSPYSLGVVSGVARLFAWKRPTLLRRVGAVPCGSSLSGSVALAALRCCQCARPLYTRHERSSAGFLASLLHSRPVAPAPPLKSGVCPCLHLCRKRQSCKHRQHYFSASPPPRGTQSRSAGVYAPALPSVGVGGSRVVLRSGATRSLWCSLLFCVLAPLPRAFAVTGKRVAFLRLVCLALPRAVVSLCAWATRAVALGAPFLSASCARGPPPRACGLGGSPPLLALPRFRRASPFGRAPPRRAGLREGGVPPQGAGRFFRLTRSRIQGQSGLRPLPLPLVAGCPCCVHAPALSCGISFFLTKVPLSCRPPLGPTSARCPLPLRAPTALLYKEKTKCRMPANSL